MSEYPVLSQVADKYVGRRGIGKTKPVSLKESEPNGIKSESNEKAKEEGSFDIDLPDVEIGKVCTQFLLEPKWISSYMQKLLF